MAFQILCQDSLAWLKSQPSHSIPNCVTGIPDMNELGKGTTFDEYLKFFKQSAQCIFQKVKEDGYCIFIQTDRKYEGQLIDKSYLLTDIAYKCGLKLMWHKIVCQRDVGKKDLFRPTYSHFLCYTIRGTPGEAFADVFPVGSKLYDNATPYNAAQAAAEFISKQIKKQKKDSNTFKYDVIDPFVGQGTIGVAMISKELSFFGIDIDKTQCRLSEELLKGVSQM